MRSFIGNKTRNWFPGAFTILELLVAMAVFAILVVMLMGMVDSGAKLWRENENRVDAYRESRAAIMMISRDLNNAADLHNSNYVRINGDIFTKLPSDAQKDSTNGGAIFFLSIQPSSAQDATNKSDLCEVGYFLAYANTSMAPAGTENTKTMNLYRYFRNSDGTYSNLISGPNSLYQNISVNGADTDVLARNIKSFRVTPYHVDTNGKWVAYDAAAYGGLPDFVEISLTALNQDTARKLEAKTDWLAPSGGLTNVINQVQQTFTTRVRISDKK